MSILVYNRLLDCTTDQEIDIRAIDNDDTRKRADCDRYAAKNSRFLCIWRNDGFIKTFDYRLIPFFNGKFFNSGLFIFYSILFLFLLYRYTAFDIKEERERIMLTRTILYSKFIC